MTRRALIVVAKQPANGQTKTRLCPPLNGQEAAVLYECFLRDTLDLIRAARQGLDLEAIITYLPENAETYFHNLAPDFSLLPQRGRDLSERLDHATTHYLTVGQYDQVVIMDSDSPTLPAECLRQAFATLTNGADLSLGPCDDGGYYLIGLKRPTADLFLEVEMSTAHVLADTLAIADRLQLQVKTLPVCFDVDTIEDLQRLAAELENLPNSVAVYTRGFLNAHPALLKEAR